MTVAQFGLRYLLVALFIVCVHAPYAAAQGTAGDSPIRGRASNLLTLPPAGTIMPQAVSKDFNPVMTSLEAPVPGSGSYRAFLAAHKAAIYADYETTGVPLYRTAEDLPTPELLRNFVGNRYNNSVPNDNNLAISNDGMLVSVINSTIWMFDVTADTPAYTASLAAFVDTLGISAGKFDPKLVFDPVEERFVLVFLGGFSDDDTYIFVCFSSSDNPMDPWHAYYLPGNPKDNGTWTDYPIIALNDDELFITVNLLLTGEPWQTGFTESIVWQVDKFDGYAGDSLDLRLWDGVDFGGKPIRNLCPLQGGSGLEGPNMYFLSNRNFDAVNDTVFLAEITGNLSDPGAQLTVEAVIADIPYGVPPEARQTNNHTFDTNDGRVLAGFIEGGLIQFVGNSVNPATGLAGVYHGVMDLTGAAPQLNAKILGDLSTDSLDYGYPNIAYTGTFDGDEQAIIGFEHSSPYVFPGLSAVYTNYGTYSPRITVKEGSSYVNVLSGFYERWGDYSGIQRVYDEPGKVWISGTYGIQVSAPFSPRRNATWIAELRATESVTAGLAEASPTERALVFPNPTADEARMEFELEMATQIEAVLLNGSGQRLRTLWSGRAKAGRNAFSMSLAPLPAGLYRIVIQGPEQIVAHLQVVKH